MERNVSKTCITPNIKFIYKELLDVIHEHNMKRNLGIIKNKAEIFGLIFLEDNAKISRCTLLNIMASRKNIPVAVLEIVDCQSHSSDGNKNMKYSFVINF